jgi:hypothetical protein
MGAFNIRAAHFLMCILFAEMFAVSTHTLMLLLFTYFFKSTVLQNLRNCVNGVGRKNKINLILSQREYLRRNDGLSHTRI